MIQSKYKVGQTVRITNDYPKGSPLRKGDVVIITDVNKTALDDIYEYQVSKLNDEYNCNWFVWEEDLESDSWVDFINSENNQKELPEEIVEQIQQDIKITSYSVSGGVSTLLTFPEGYELNYALFPSLESEFITRHTGTNYIPNEFKREYVAEFIDSNPPCEHTFTVYEGIVEKYDYCTKCNKKRDQ